MPLARGFKQRILLRFCLMFLIATIFSNFLDSLFYKNERDSHKSCGSGIKSYNDFFIVLDSPSLNNVS